MGNPATAKTNSGGGAKASIGVQVLMPRKYAGGVGPPLIHKEMTRNEVYGTTNLYFNYLTCDLWDMART